MQRAREQRGAVGLLDDAAEIHDGDRFTDMLHNAEVVRNKQHRQSEFALQAPQEMEDLRLDRDVERSRRFIGNQHIGLARQRMAIITRWHIPPES